MATTVEGADTVLAVLGFPKRGTAWKLKTLGSRVATMARYIIVRSDDA